jgi:hypothetical protein
MPKRQPNASAASYSSHPPATGGPNAASFTVLGVLTLTTIVVAASTWQSTLPGNGACISPFGIVNGQDASGVIGYSNCNDSFVSDEESYVSAGGPTPVYAGLKWQCVEYGRRWLILNLQVLYSCCCSGI